MTRITRVREDLCQLITPFYDNLARDRDERRQRELSGHPDAPISKAPDSLVIVTWPTGWNHEGTPVRFEAETVTEVGGQKLTVRAKSERGLEREMRFRVAELLMAQDVPSAEARKQAIRVPVIVADRLERRPSRGEVLAANGEVANAR